MDLINEDSIYIDNSQPLVIQTNIHKPNIPYVKELLQEIMSVKGVPFSFSKISEIKQNTEQEIIEIDKNIKEILSQKIERELPVIDYTSRTENKNHIIMLIIQYYNYGHNIFFTTKNNSRKMVTNNDVIDIFVRRYKEEVNVEPLTLIDLLQEYKTLSHKRSNLNQLIQAKAYYNRTYKKDTGSDIFFAFPELNIGNTGRVSCSKPAIQSLTEDAKMCITAPDGYKIVSMDIKGQEVHILINGILKNEKIKQAYKKHQDPYLAFLEVLGYPLDKQHRNKAKVPILGLMNGMGFNSINKQLNDREFATNMMNLIEKDEGYVNKVLSYVKDESKSKTKFRKGLLHTRFETNRFANEETQLRNGFFQVTAAEITSLSLQQVIYDIYKKYGNFDYIRPLLTIYDEFLFIVKDEYIQEAEQLIKKNCLPIIDDWTQFLGEIQVGQSYMH